jgi:hypothetical protein
MPSLAELPVPRRRYLLLVIGFGLVPALAPVLLAASRFAVADWWRVALVVLMAVGAECSPPHLTRRRRVQVVAALVAHIDGTTMTVPAHTVLASADAELRRRREAGGAR